jgi:predicted ribosome quality control (RQC) complex YloA/Tae2 family protein
VLSPPSYASLSLAFVLPIFTTCKIQKYVSSTAYISFELILSKTFLLKFALPDRKVYVVIESGIRIHSTVFEREKSQMPNGFTMKLRKYLRTRRLESVQQMGVDRVVDFYFGSKDSGYHLVCEFYAKGNVLLTDHEYRIIALLRAHSREEDVRFAVGEIYPVGKRLQFAKMTRENLLSSLQKQTASATVDDKGLQLKNILNHEFDYGTGFVEHCITAAGLDANIKISQLKISSDSNDDISKLVNAFQEADNFIEKCGEEPQKGYIILRSDKTTEQQQQQSMLTAEELREKQRARYDDFTPFLYKQLQKFEHVEFVSFDQCVDEYFSTLETQKIEAQKNTVDKSVNKKLEKVKQEQQQRIEELGRSQEEYNRMAQLIEENLDAVDQAIKIVCSAVAQGIDWEDIKQVIKEQKKLGDSIAQMIGGLKLETNQITMLLKSSDGIDKAPTKIDIDIGLTAFANAKSYYDMKKKFTDKYNKTIESSEKAIKAAEKKTTQTKQKKQVKADIHLMRKRFWFEKFNWFISSENYLVISGRDAQQNEQIVKRYMKKGDIYVHADIHGAASCVIKNPTGSLTRSTR